MRQFASIEKLDSAILYVLELASSLSMFLLTFGLVASMTNVLTKGLILSDNSTMQVIWSASQSIGIDASISGTIIRCFTYYRQKQWVQAGLYTILSLLILFTAAIVSNIEAVQQTLNIVLDVAYAHVFVSVEALIWIRSVTIVLLIVSHAVKHISVPPTSQKVKAVSPKTAQPPQTRVQPEAPVVQKERTPKAPTPINTNLMHVKKYLDNHPDASAREVGRALGFSATTAAKWVNKVRYA